jgi:hypothetical protein
MYYHSMKTARNSPCPCGSGKKYKRCCGNPAAQMTKDLMEEVSGHNFPSLDALNAFIQQKVTAQNNAPLKEFLGLSSSQMHLMLNAPFDCPDVITFNNEWVPKNSVVMNIFKMLSDAIPAEGLKATAKGNLPLKLSRDIRDNTPKGDLTFRDKINSEEEFCELHMTRLISDLGGLIKLRKGRFYLTKKGDSLSQVQNKGLLFQALLKSYTTRFNWGYLDGFSDDGRIEIIQKGWLFSLYCLLAFGKQWRPLSFYANYFFEAFPEGADDLLGYGNITPEEAFKSCYSLRTFERFAYCFGLVEMRKQADHKPWARNYDIKADDISQWIKFHA